MAQTIQAQFSFDPTDSSQKIQSVRSEMRQLKEQLLEIPKDDPQWGVLFKRYAELKGNVAEVNRLAKALDPNERVNAFMKIGEAGVGAFGAMKGASELFGGANEETLEALKKIEATMLVLRGIKQFDEGIKAGRAMLDVFIATHSAAKANVAVTAEQTAATEAGTVAQEGATVATKTFGVALKSIGIGLVIAALAYLITHIKEISKWVTDLIPGLKNFGDTWDKIKGVAFGVGNAIIQYIIAPLKAVWDLVHGDFKKALDDLANGGNVVKNFQKGQADELQSIAEDHRKEMLKIQLEETADEITVRKARGEDTYAMEAKYLKDKLSLEEEGSKEHKKISLDIRVNDAQHEKQLQDDRDKAAHEREEKAKAAAAKLLEIKKQYQEFELKLEKEIAETAAQGGGVSAATAKYQKELVDIKAGLAAEKVELDKARKANIISEQQYNTEISQINNLAAAKEVLSAKTRDEGLLKEKDAAAKKEIEIAKTIGERTELELEQQRIKGTLTEVQYQQKLIVLKNAALEQEKAILKKYGLDTTAIEKQIADNTLADVKIIEKAKLDSANRQLKHLKDQNKAILDNDKLTFAQRKKLLDENEIAIKAFTTTTVEQESEKKAAEADYTQASENLSKKRNDVKKQELQAAEGLLNSAADLLGKNTAAGKAAAIAATTIQTYQAAQQAFTSFSAIPIVGVGLGIAAAAAAVISGIARVKAIEQTNVPGSTLGSSAANPIITQSGGALSFSTPNIGQSNQFTNLSPSTINQIASATNQQPQLNINVQEVTDAQNRVNAYTNSAGIAGASNN